MHMLTRDEILNASDLSNELIEVPEWDGDVTIRTLTGKERDDFEQEIMDSKKGDKIKLVGLKARLIALSAVDDNGVQLFTAEDVEALNAKSSRAINRLFVAAQKLSGLGDDEVEALLENS